MRKSEEYLTALYFRLDCPSEATAGIADPYLNRCAVVIAKESGHYRAVAGPAFGPGLGSTRMAAEKRLRDMATR
jgi:hypothetical protein